VPRERLTHPLGLERAAADGHHAAVRAAQHVDNHLLLAAAELRLAVTVEERLDRLAERLLELAVAVERPHPQLGGHGAGRARLAGPHEAHEHERAGASRPGPRGRCRAACRYRLHPIRSRYASTAAATSSMWSPPNLSR
jgi:hypothetical protein